MAQVFKLILRKNLGKDKNDIPEKYYAQAVSNGFVTFDELCDEIAEQCTLTSADTKAMLDRMNVSLNKHLRAGRIVQFGEIGNFRLSLGSSGSMRAKDFDTSQIRTPKIVFTPGSKLREMRSLTTFERQPMPKPEESERPEEV